jgi:hypothetical protein
MVTDEALEQEKAEVTASLQEWQERLAKAQAQMAQAMQEIYAHKWHLGRLEIMGNGNKKPDL